MFDDYFIKTRLAYKILTLSVGAKQPANKWRSTHPRTELLRDGLFVNCLQTWQNISSLAKQKKYSINRHSVLVSIPKLVWTLNFDFHNFSQNLNLDCVEKKFTGILNCKNDLLLISFTVLHYSVSIATWVPVCRFQERRHIGLSPGPC